MSKKKIKALLGRLLFSVRAQKALLGERSVIVAFHRVSESATNSPINCTPPEFEDYCRFLRDHFEVISLRELLERVAAGRSIAGTAVITFDDGYKDNCEVAAPILKALGLPATFFVTTNFIGSDTQTFWDAERGVQSEWMSWRDVATLNSERFDIGCHTENHIDLGKVDLQLAKREIENSKQRLENELNVDVRHFAYPFGGRNNIRPETLALVKEAGFACCVSCHGGLATPQDDVYMLPRVPISTWHDSPHHFAFELLRP